MAKFIRVGLFLTFLFLIGCGNGEAPFTKVVVKSNERGVLLDTEKRSVLKEVHELFYDRKEFKEADAEFLYFIDITVGSETTRWQYSDEGYIRNYEAGSTAMIYEVSSVNAFNSVTRIK